MARNKFVVARRSIWYVLRTLLIIVGVFALCLSVFTTAMYASNIYIIVTEGMQKRAECILQDGSVLDLTEYFTQSFVDGDTELYAGKYADFTVSNYDYRLELKGLKVFPWSSGASVEAVERLASISAAYNEPELNEKGEAETAAAPAVPEWTPVRYEIKFVRVGTRWYISALNVLETNPAQEAKPTPDMSLYAAPTEEP